MKTRPILGAPVQSSVFKFFACSHVIDEISRSAKPAFFFFCIRQR